MPAAGGGEETDLPVFPKKTFKKKRAFRTAIQFAIAAGESALCCAAGRENCE